MKNETKCVHCARKLKPNDIYWIGDRSYCWKCFDEEIGIRPRTIAGIVPVKKDWPIYEDMKKEP